MTHYAKRDAMSLEPHYSAHVSAMTTEALHSKADIAAELAFRDQRIARLEAELATKHETLETVVAQLERAVSEKARLKSDLSIAVCEKRQAEAQSAFSSGKPIDRGVFLAARMAHLAHLRDVDGDTDYQNAVNLHDPDQGRFILMHWDELQRKRGKP